MVSRDLEIALYILGSMCVLMLAILVFISPFVYLWVEERKYRKWEKENAKSTRLNKKG